MSTQHDPLKVNCLLCYYKPNNPKFSPQLHQSHHAFHFQTAMQKNTEIRAFPCQLVGRCFLLHLIGSPCSYFVRLWEQTGTQKSGTSTSYTTKETKNKESGVEWRPLFTAIGRTRCLDRTGGLAMSAISIKPTNSISEEQKIQIGQYLHDVQILGNNTCYCVFC